MKQNNNTTTPQALVHVSIDRPPTSLPKPPGRMSRSLRRFISSNFTEQRNLDDAGRLSRTVVAPVPGSKLLRGTTMALKKPAVHHGLGTSAVSFSCRFLSNRQLGLRSHRETHMQPAPNLLRGGGGAAESGSSQVPTGAADQRVAPLSSLGFWFLGSLQVF